jgi:hypothetical protein
MIRFLISRTPLSLEAFLSQACVAECQRYAHCWRYL